jgi:hypothetical protein
VTFYLQWKKKEHVTITTSESNMWYLLSHVTLSFTWDKCHMLLFLSLKVNVNMLLFLSLEVNVTCYFFSLEMKENVTCDIYLQWKKKWHVTFTASDRKRDMWHLPPVKEKVTCDIYCKRKCHMLLFLSLAVNVTCYFFLHWR